MSTLGLFEASTRLLWIADRARRMPEAALTNLSQFIDVEFIRDAFRRTRKDGAVGVDGKTAADFEQDLEGNLKRLHELLKSGCWRAPPVRRVHIPKGTGGKTRPIGIPTFEDKVLQRAVAMVLEAVYEQSFMECSYGFRPGRSAHQALDAVWRDLTEMKGGWVVDVDIKGFFDSIDHGHLRDFLDLRVRDGVLRRAIGKWLNAGVMESGRLSYPDAGTPQGGVVSPILANVFLHHVLDDWFERVVKPRLRGRASLVRYADDFVIMCAEEYDARRIFDVLPKRFARFGLTLHPEKTKLVDFRRPRIRRGKMVRGRAWPGSFDLLGFTHYWRRSRRERWVVGQKTAKSRFNRAVLQIAQWCRKNRHRPVAEQHRTLSLKLKGHDAYYGITGNYTALRRLRQSVTRYWRKWLDRRSRAAGMTWGRFTRLLQRYPLPRPRVVHSVYEA